MSTWGEVRAWTAIAVVAAANGVHTATTVLVGLQDELDGCSTTGGWTGVAARAADLEHEQLTERLRRLVAQTAAVCTALDQAAESILAVNREVLATEAFAASWLLTVGDDGAVRGEAPTPPDDAVTAQQRARATAEVVDRVVQVLRTATDVDHELAAVLEAAVHDGIDDGTGSGLRGAASTTAGNLGAPAPPDGTPADAAAWWATLTPVQQSTLLLEHPDVIGNRDGIPAAVRSAANVARLPGLEADLQGRAAALQSQLDQRPGRWESGRLADQLALVVGAQRALAAIRATLRKGGRQLLLVDTTGERVTAAVAVGDVDTADHVSVFTPGFGSSVEGDPGGGEGLASYDGAADQLGDQAQRLLDRTGGETVATVTWLGCSPPGGDVRPHLASLEPDNLAGIYPVVADAAARRGAASLASFLRGIDASREVDPHLTALGHSYGSLTTSLALQQGTGVDDVVLFGSPGLGTDAVADLGLPPGHVYLEEAHDDPVADLGAFGRDPSALPGLAQLDTGAETLSDGTPGAASKGHTQYTDQGDPGDEDYRRTSSTANMAAIVAGRSDGAVHGSDPGIGDALRAALQGGQDVVSTADQALGDPLGPWIAQARPALDRALGAAHDLVDGGERALDGLGDLTDDATALGRALRAGVLNLDPVQR